MKTLPRVASGLLLAGLLQAAAIADVVPPPATVNDAQKLLIGTWHETECAVPWGHGCPTRTIAFGNADVAIVRFDGIPLSGHYHVGAESGSWVAEGGKIKITVNGEIRYEATLEGAGFVLQDLSLPNVAPTHFKRAGGPIIND